MGLDGAAACCPRALCPCARIAALIAADCSGTPSAPKHQFIKIVAEEYGLLFRCVKGVASAIVIIALARFSRAALGMFPFHVLP